MYSFQETIWILLVAIGSIVGFIATVCGLYFGSNWLVARLTNFALALSVYEALVRYYTATSTIIQTTSQHLYSYLKSCIVYTATTYKHARWGVYLYTKAHSNAFAIFLVLLCSSITLYIVPHRFNILAIVTLGLGIGIVSAPFSALKNYHQNKNVPQALRAGITTIFTGIAVFMILTASLVTMAID